MRYNLLIELYTFKWYLKKRLFTYNNDLFIEKFTIYTYFFIEINGRYEKRKFKEINTIIVYIVENIDFI